MQSDTQLGTNGAGQLDAWSDPPCKQSALPREPRILSSRSSSPLPKLRDVGNEKGKGESLHIDLSARHRGKTTGGDRAALEVSEINGDFLRLTPDDIGAEQVVRVPRQKIPFQPLQAPNASKPWHSLTRHWGRAPRQSMKWLMLAGAAVVTLVVGTMLLLPQVNRANAVSLRSGDLVLVMDAEHLDDRTEAIALMMQRQNEVVEIYERLCESNSVDDMLSLLRDSEAIRPLLIESGWRAVPQIEQGKWKWGAGCEGDLVFGILNGVRDDYSKMELYFCETDSGLKLDWKATTAHSSADFAELARGSGDTSEIRGYLQAADFFTLAFPEDDYRSYRFQSSKTTDSVWVYAPIDSAMAQSLETSLRAGDILAAESKRRKVTLRLGSPPDGAMANQWLMMELLHKEWIAP